MIKPTRNDIPTSSQMMILIAVLRVAGCSQDSTSAILNIGKKKVVEAERWIREADLQHVKDVLRDSAIKQGVIKSLAKSQEVDGELLAIASSLSRDEILGHYRYDWPEPALPLILHPPVVKLWSESKRGPHGYYVNMCVSTSHSIAPHCWAKAMVRDLGGPAFPLHFRGTPVTEEEFSAPQVDIHPDMPGELDIAFALPTHAFEASGMKGNISGRIAVISISGNTGQAASWTGTGCWIAQPLALFRPSPDLRAYLKQGVYHVDVSVGYEGGPDSYMEMEIFSPHSWQALKVKIVKGS